MQVQVGLTREGPQTVPHDTKGLLLVTKAHSDADERPADEWKAFPLLVGNKEQLHVEKHKTSNGSLSKTILMDRVCVEVLSSRHTVVSWCKAPCLFSRLCIWKIQALLKSVHALPN